MMPITKLMRGSSKFLQNYRSISLFYGKCRQKEKIADMFTPVYKFPYILPFSMINRLKMYQTGLTIASIPTLTILNQLNYVAFDTAALTAKLGITGCLTLYSLGYITEKFIGFIYYNEEKDVAKISYIDFWGKRKDIEVPAQDMVPLNELPIMPTDGLFLTLRRFSSKETLRLTLRFGIVLDKDKIRKIL